MHKHHQESINNLVCMFSNNPDVLAIILGGSIAKGKEKINSDIDAMVILEDNAYERYVSSNKLAECIFDHCTYENGYFDLKYFNKDYLVKASESGSEPTRYSFTGARCIHSLDEEINTLIREIPVYPIQLKQEKILSFYSALALNNFFFWDEAHKRDDRYLKMRVASDIVLFGLRLVLAYNNRLFPCHKWLLSAVEEVPNKPEGIIQKVNTFLESLTDESKDIFINSVDSLIQFERLADPEKRIEMVCTRFIEDNEWWWWKNRPNIAEW